MHGAIIAAARLMPVSLAQQLARLAFTVALARWLGPTSYGVFGTLFVLIEVLAFPAGLGLPQAVVRFAAPYFRHQDRAHLSGMLRFARVTILGVGAALTALLAWTLVRLAQPHLSEDTLFHLFLAAPLGALVQVQGGYLLAIKYVGASLASRQLVPDLATLLGVLLLLPLLPTVTVHENVWMITLGYAVTALWQAVLIARRAGSDTRPSYLPAEWLRRSLPLALSASGTALVTRLDLLLAGWLEGALAVAVFFPVFVVAGLAMIPVNAVMATFKPRFANSEIDELPAVCRDLAQTLWTVNTPTVLLLALGGTGLLSLYGEAHTAQAVPILYVTSAARLLVPLRLSANTLIKLKGDPWHATMSLIVGTASALGSALLLYRGWSLLGIAIGFAFGFVVGIGMRMVLASRSLGVSYRAIIGR